MKFPMAFYILAFALPFNIGCAQKQKADNGMWTTKDSWYRPSAKLIDPDSDKSHIIPDQEYRSVKASQLPVAQKMLEKTPIVPLSTQQVFALAGKNFVAPQGKAPFLVRALYLNAETGGFSVYQQGEVLFVEHDSLGHSAVPMKRAALVIFLQTRPKKLFLDVGMDE